MNKLWYRSRGLRKLEMRLGRNIVKDFIKKRFESQKEIRILEIGFGEGKVLLDLRVLFPDKRVKLFGINKKKEGNMHGRDDFLKNARKFGLKVDKNNLPKCYFYDAGDGLKFKDNYFDLIISQVSFHYVGNKAKLLEEIWRVLNKGGEAFLHIDEDARKKSPDWMYLNADTPRFVIYEKDKIIKLEYYLNRYKRKGFEIGLKKNKNRLLIFIKKTLNKKLNLKLGFDKISSMDLQKISSGDEYKKAWGVWWGTRSVFNVKK